MRNDASRLVIVLQHSLNSKYPPLDMIFLGNGHEIGMHTVDVGPRVARARTWLCGRSPGYSSWVLRHVIVFQPLLFSLPWHIINRIVSMKLITSKYGQDGVDGGSFFFLAKASAVTNSTRPSEPMRSRLHAHFRLPRWLAVHNAPWSCILEELGFHGAVCAFRYAPQCCLSISHDFCFYLILFF